MPNGKEEFPMPRVEREEEKKELAPKKVMPEKEVEEIKKEKEPIEIERKFLVKELPENLERYPHKEISQGYIAIAEDGTEVRIRKVSREIKGKERNEYYQTIKSGGEKIREEIETRISKKQFEALWPATEDKRIEKTRYDIRHETGTIELDVFKGDLEGLVTTEMEFDSEEKSNEIEPPEWFGEEVTEDEKFKNKNLATFGNPLEEEKGSEK